MRRLFYLAVTLLCLTPGLASASPKPRTPHWTACYFRLDHKEPKRCIHVPMPKHKGRRPGGHRKHCSWTGSDWLCVTTPRFTPKPQGYWLTAFTTGYDDLGSTRSGLSAGWGRVATDWSVFPQGTHFYIPGYGDAYAEDTGGDVHGTHIDTWWPTAAQCDAFTGLRRVFVYR